MDVHENARTTPRSRMLMMELLEADWTIAADAAAVGVDGRMVREWRDRFRAGRPRRSGVDRSSRPRCSPPLRLDTAAEAEIEALRRAPVRAGDCPPSRAAAVYHRHGAATAVLDALRQWRRSSATSAKSPAS